MHHRLKKNPSISILLDDWAWSLNLTDIEIFEPLDSWTWWIEEWQGLAGGKVRMCCHCVPCWWRRYSGTDWKFPLRLRVLLLRALCVVIMTSPKPNLSLELCCYISFLGCWSDLGLGLDQSCKSAVAFQSCAVKENTESQLILLGTPEWTLNISGVLFFQKFHGFNFSTERNTVGFSLT